MNIGFFVRDYMVFVPWDDSPVLELAVLVCANCVLFRGMYSMVVPRFSLGVDNVGHMKF